jgi:hypothetical protein
MESPLFERPTESLAVAVQPNRPFQNYSILEPLISDAPVPANHHVRERWGHWYQYITEGIVSGVGIEYP